MKTAFYPCCGRDVEEPRRILAGEVQRIVFCDIDPTLERVWRNITTTTSNDGLPAAEFIVGDALGVLSRIDAIDLLFYRGDSDGEGGSGLFVLGDVFLRPLLERFVRTGGVIVTDGANSRGGNFKKMTRRAGLMKHGWSFSASSNQPYLAQHGLSRISVLHVPTRGN